MINVGAKYAIPITLIVLGYIIFLGICKDIFVFNQLNMKSIVITSMLLLIWIVFTLVITRLFLPAIGYKYHDKDKGGDGFKSNSCPKK